ncbi:hypothetical protein [Adlercreutzia equolifaciens]|uniref:hypothetical protein n=1 Tax=Adlercreutzia equolifaciens TaxID=446660 RepID=UPI0023B0147C|nr:hypothetical protein [Adlercreutzia equolifaciens]
MTIDYLSRMRKGKKSLVIYPFSCNKRLYGVAKVLLILHLQVRACVLACPVLDVPVDQQKGLCLIREARALSPEKR